MKLGAKAQALTVFEETHGRMRLRIQGDADARRNLISASSTDHLFGFELQRLARTAEAVVALLAFPGHMGGDREFAAIGVAQDLTLGLVCGLPHLQHERAGEYNGHDGSDWGDARSEAREIGGGESEDDKRDQPPRGRTPHMGFQENAGRKGEGGIEERMARRGRAG